MQDVWFGSEADVKPISRQATSGAMSGIRLGRDVRWRADSPAVSDEMSSTLRAGRCVEKDAEDKRAAKVGPWLAEAEDEEADGVGNGSNGEHAGEP